MKRWALIINNIVDNVTEQEDEPQIGGTWVDITGQHVGPGYSYDGTTFTAPPPPQRIISKASMLARFTDEEFVDILVVAKVNPQVEAWKIKFDVATEINLDDPRTQSGINMLADKGILTTARANAIINAPI